MPNVNCASHAPHCSECHGKSKFNNDTFHFWKKNDHVVRKVWVVVRELFAFGIGAGLFLFNPPLFAVAFIGGAVLQPILCHYKFFDTLKKIYLIDPALSTIILALGAILSYPSSTWMATAYYGFWLGKHMADIALSKERFPGY